MSGVPTVRGEVAAADLGVTLMHEHVFVLSTEVLLNHGHTYWNEDERVADAVARLGALRSRGVTTIVDLTVLGLGRDVARIARVNVAVDLNIVVATGLYTYDAVPLFVRDRGPGTLLGGEDPLTRMFIADIEEGIGTTGVRAGMLKCCVDSRGVTRGVERTLRAVADAHLQTGVPITVHTNARRQTGREALRVLSAAGVDPQRVVIAHAGDSTDLDYLRALMDTGAVAGMDRFGLDGYASTADRVATVAALVREGYTDRMVLSQDAACFMDWFPTEADRAAIRERNPDWHHLHISDHVLPALRRAGVGDGDIRRMLVETPRRLLAGAGAVSAGAGR